MDEANELRGSLQLIGTVKSVIFQNEENGYTVLRLDVGGDEPVTVVGCLPFAAPGEGLTVEGAWERHRATASPVQGVLSHALAAGGGEAYL